MNRFRWLGVDRLRVSAFWDQIAPQPGRRNKPQLRRRLAHATRSTTSRNLDRVVHSAAAHGLKVMISITTPAPLWATGDPPSTTACGSRSRTSSRSSRARSRHATGAQRGPVRDHATSRTSPAGCGRRATKRGYYAPHHYRRMVNAAFPAIRAGSPRDTILVGELAASGSVNRGPGSSIRPLAFLRAFALRLALVPQAQLGPLPQLQGAARGRDRPPPVHRSSRARRAIRPTATTPPSATAGGCCGSSTGSSGSDRLISARGGKLQRPLHGVRVPDRSARPLCRASR